MKKIFFLLLISNSFNLFSINLYDNPVFKKLKNDFVIYIDQRTKNPILHGFQYIDDNEYLIRYFDFSNNEEFVVKVPIKVTKTDIEMSNFEFIKGNYNMENVQKVISVFWLLINNDDRLERNRFPQTCSYKQTYTVDNINYEQNLIYQFWVPVFGLEKIEQTKPEKGSLILLAFGRPGPDNKGNFLDIYNYPGNKESPRISIPKMKKNNKKINGISILLDDNWSLKNDNYYKISKMTEQDAAVVVQDIEFNDEILNSPFVYIYQNLITFQLFIPGNSINVNIYNDRIISDFSVFDSKSQTYSRVFLILKKIDNNQYKLINLSSFYSVFEDNEKYFIDIINSIK